MGLAGAEEQLLGQVGLPLAAATQPVLFLCLWELGSGTLTLFTHHSLLAPCSSPS